MEIVADLRWDSGLTEGEGAKGCSENFPTGDCRLTAKRFKSSRVKTIYTNGE